MFIIRKLWDDSGSYKITLEQMKGILFPWLRRNSIYFNGKKQHHKDMLSLNKPIHLIKYNKKLPNWILLERDKLILKIHVENKN